MPSAVRHPAPPARATPDPLDVARAWPADRSLLMLHSARLHPRWARWSILASPAAIYRFTPGGGSRLDGELPGGALHFADDPLEDLQRLLARTRRGPASGGAPFEGGWIGYLSYDLGRLIEPAVDARTGGAVVDRAWPLIELAWCPDALVYDGLQRRWHALGAAPQPRPVDAGDDVSDDAPLIAGALTPTLSRERYIAAAARIIEYIRAGDIFQANLALRLSAPWCGSARGLALRALRRAEPWYGACLELPSGTVISLSPELFMQVSPDGKVITRPIKGTRPASVDPRELAESRKDAAELNMIIDLMRNDLGRVCATGSVRVTQQRTVESHPTVHHGVAEVSGVLRPEVGPAALLAATFPGGSITGAPKIRAMQIIDELEPVRRGPAFGAIGFFSDSGDVRLSIAIRTILLSNGMLDYSAGAGIVADSNEALEHEECLAKAAVLGL